MPVLPADGVEYRSADGTVKSGRVTMTASDGRIVVQPDGGCQHLGCKQMPPLEQITMAAIVTVNRALHSERG